MVVIHIKNSDKHQFLYETSAQQSVDLLITELVLFWNLRIRIGLLADFIDELCSNGPVRKDFIDKCGQIQGQSDQEGLLEKYPITSKPPGPKLSEALRKLARDSRLCISAEQVKAKVFMTPELLQEKIDAIGHILTLAYPNGLPENDPVRLLLEGKFLYLSQNMQRLDQSTAQLWWAGKPFDRSKLVQDRTGQNEKTKIVAKLTNYNSGPPTREPALSNEEQKRILYHYIRKQEEVEHLSADNDDQNSNWANMRALKSALHGTTKFAFNKG